MRFGSRQRRYAYYQCESYGYARLPRSDVQERRKERSLRPATIHSSTTKGVGARVARQRPRSVSAWRVVLLSCVAAGEAAVEEEQLNTWRPLGELPRPPSPRLAPRRPEHGWQTLGGRKGVSGRVGPHEY